jgi:GTP-binding protein
MQITKAIFKKSAAALKDCPDSNWPEYAFIGRSNVGKSSLINMLCNNKKLAKTSATPGKTQLINFFTINDSWGLVDLPGYGYAKAAKSKLEGFEKLISTYCEKRDNLRCLFILIDSRLPLQKIDLEFLQWCAVKNIPFSLVYTKADKNTKNELARNLKNIEKELLKHWDEMPNSFVTSAEKKLGKEEILEFIDHLNKEVAKDEEE